jgi:hypothetical protein
VPAVGNLLLTASGRNLVHPVGAIGNAWQSGEVPGKAPSLIAPPREAGGGFFYWNLERFSFTMRPLSWGAFQKAIPEDSSRTIGAGIYCWKLVNPERHKNWAPQQDLRVNLGSDRAPGE